MKTVEDFIDSMVDIELMEDGVFFGHCPFKILVEHKDGTHEIGSLDSGGDIASYFRIFAEKKNSGAKRIYLSLDLQKAGDIDNDYVGIFSLENGIVDLFAIPYQLTDGKVLDRITDSTQLDLIKKNLLRLL